MYAIFIMLIKMAEAAGDEMAVDPPRWAWLGHVIDAGMQTTTSAFRGLRVMGDAAVTVAAATPGAVRVTTDAMKKGFSAVASAAQTVHSIADVIMHSDIMQPRRKSKRIDALLELNAEDMLEKANASDNTNLYGRDAELELLVAALMKIEKSSAFLVGDPGIGKTNIVEGLAMLMSRRDPNVKSLENMQLYSIRPEGIMAGAAHQGDLERRVRKLIKTAIDENVILFIDEIHLIFMPPYTMIKDMFLVDMSGKGLRIIGATNPDKYQALIARDSAIVRRIDVINVREPSNEVAVQMIESKIKNVERHHSVFIPRETIQTAVIQTDRFMPNKRLPDKASDIINKTAVKKEQTLTVLYGKLMQLMIEREKLIKRISVFSLFSQDKVATLQAELAKIDEEIELLEESEETREAVIRLFKLKEELKIHATHLQNAEGDPGEVISGLAARTKRWYDETRREIDEMTHSDILRPLLTVSSADIIDAVVLATSISLAKQQSLDTASAIAKQIVGQQHVIAEVSAQINITYNFGKFDSKRPTRFFFIGPTGVGKTEMAKAIQRTVFPGEEKFRLLILSMQNYDQDHNAATLTGSPAGYVGYERGGILTNFVSQNPNSVVVFDEIEKAHPSVIAKFLLSILDEGTLTAQNGEVVNFKFTIIILTSNIGAAPLGAVTSHSSEEDKKKAVEQARNELATNPKFTPEIRGRIGLPLCFFSLHPDEVKQLVKLVLDNYTKRLLEEHNATVDFTERFIDFCAIKKFNKASGARSVESYVAGEVHNFVGTQLKFTSKIRVDVTEAGKLTIHRDAGKFALMEMDTTEDDTGSGTPSAKRRQFFRIGLN